MAYALELTLMLYESIKTYKTLLSPVYMLPIDVIVIINDNWNDYDYNYITV